MRFNWVCVVTALVSIINLCPRAYGQEPIASIIPGQGRVVGLLEWIEAESTKELAEKIDPDRCEIILEGPDGRISGELEYSKARLKFVPAGTRRVNMTMRRSTGMARP